MTKKKGNQIREWSIRKKKSHQNHLLNRWKREIASKILIGQDKTEDDDQNQQSRR
jgi:hypothetical protein